MSRIKSLTPGRSRIEKLFSRSPHSFDRRYWAGMFWGWQMQLGMNFPIEHAVLPWVPLPSQKLA
ncbi:hypothetical protein AMTRI_Chr06g195750 [Amborella trichopoda]